MKEFEVEKALKETLLNTSKPFDGIKRITIQSRWTCNASLTLILSYFNLTSLANYWGVKRLHFPKLNLKKLTEVNDGP